MIGSSDNSETIYNYIIDTNPANELDNMVNAMCDERVDAINICRKLYFTTNQYKKIQQKVIDLEPKIYDDNSTYLKYTHYNGDNLLISLR
jgi:hypothetical protein